MRRSSRIGLVTTLVISAMCAQAQIAPTLSDGENKAFPEPAPSASLLTFLSADYLSDEERADLSVRHGVWEPEHLADARRMALSALIRGAYADQELSNPEIPVEIRALGALGRGDPAAALSLLEGVESPQSKSIRARALWDSGRMNDAAREAQPLWDMLISGQEGDPDTIVACAQASLILIRVNGTARGDGEEYRKIMQELGRVRTQIEPLSFGACLAEAQLLYAKDNYADSGKALDEALKLNPRNAESWALFGQLMVDSLELDKAEAIAARLDLLAAPNVSPHAAIVRARAAMRRNRWSDATRAIDDALKAFPNHRELLATKCATLAGTYDLAQIEACLKSFDELGPGSPDAALAVGKALSDARQYEEASIFLSRAAERAPNHIDPLIELGLLELQAGRLDEADRALARAAAIDNFNVRADNSRKLLEELRTFVNFESDHFIVRTKPGIDEIVAKEMLEPLERIYARVTGSQAGGIDHKPSAKTVVELYPSHRWFAVRITGMTGIHTIAAATGPVIAMERPAVGAGHPMGVYDWARVVQHEFTHTVTLSRTKNRLPHWFTEASAVYLEDAPRDFRTILLLRDSYETDTLFDLDSINIAFAKPKRPTDRQLAYAQGHWMYEYIITRFGGKAVLDLMDLYAKGSSEAEAFTSVLGLTRERFLADFKAWARGELEKWCVVQPEGKPGLRELLDEHNLTGDDLTDEKLNEWLRSYPEHPELLAKLAEKFEEKIEPGRELEAVELLERYARACPVDPMPHRVLAKLYLESKIPGKSADDAVPHLEYLDIREQYSPAYATELAKRYASRNNRENALKKAKRATQISPYDARTREAAATVALRVGDLNEAEHQIRVLIALEPDREIHKQRLEALLKKKNG